VTTPGTSDLTEALGPKAGELAPAAGEMLRSALASTRPNAHLLPVEEARRNYEADYAAVGPGEEVQEVQDLTVPVAGGAVPARLYRPSDGRLPAVVYLHGGGWLLGSVDSHDGISRALANASGAAVMSVGYRRGPEHRFPTAVDVARLARERGGPALALTVLAYPVTTTDLDVGFDDDYEGYFLYRDELQWHQDNYLPTPDVRHDPLVSPLEADDLEGLPPAVVITAQCDPLHRQGVLYAAAVERAGGLAEHLHYPGMVHGFFALPSEFEEGADAVRRVGAALAGTFGAQARGR
jgi:acetyl esterase